MTKYHSKNIQFFVTNGPTDGGAGLTGTLQNIGPYVNSVDIPRTADEVDVTTFGAGTFRQYLSGFQNATIRLGGFFDDTAASGGSSSSAGTVGSGSFFPDWLDNNGTQTRRFVFCPSGTASTTIKYEGTAICLGYSLNGAVANAVSFTSDMRVTGAIRQFSGTIFYAI